MAGGSREFFRRRASRAVTVKLSLHRGVAELLTHPAGRRLGGGGGQGSRSSSRGRPECTTAPLESKIFSGGDPQAPLPVRAGARPPPGPQGRGRPGARAYIKTNVVVAADDERTTLVRGAIDGYCPCFHSVRATAARVKIVSLSLPQYEIRLVMRIPRILSRVRRSR